MSSSRKQSSIWEQEADHSKIKNYFPELSTDTNCEVCIIGAGITGLTLAYLLASEGKDVVVLEGDHIGAGATGATSAHLDPLTDTRPSDLLERFGLEQAGNILDSNFKAMKLIEEISRIYALDCEFKKIPGTFLAGTDEEQLLLEEEFEASKKLKLNPRFEQHSNIPFGQKAKLSFDLHARFQPVKYLFSLAKAARQKGARIFHGARVDNIKDSTAFLKGRQAKAKTFVMATHMPFGLHPIIQSRVYPFRSYLITAKLKSDFPDELFWDLNNPYHYMRRLSDSKPNVVLLGGADHRTGEKVNTMQSYVQLQRYASKHLDVESFESMWSAQFYLSADGLPLIGKASPFDDVYFATGFEGNGLTFGTVAAQLIADQIFERDNPAAKIYSPNRLNLTSSGKRFIMENFTTAKDFLMDRIDKNEQSPESLELGEGKVLTYKGEQLACYRDESGKLHALSPVCPHAKCHVRFNNSESSWDCPCHGGRFSATGELLQGPPTQDLKKRDDLLEEIEREDRPPA
ncbi:MAG: FAD-dependent oxidoreductase [Bacteriovoracaceae bacterium]|nr:FAD-dependent oxidoreductase [Bacteriovoracaceae bacterium]